MATKPAPPADEEPLDAATIDRFLSNMGPGMVLVGGQALAFWMDRFGIAVEDAAISNDGDALGSVARARDVALAMQAKLVVPAKASRTALVAQLRLPVGRGKTRNIDVLHMLYTIGGPSKSAAFTKRVVRDSVEAEWRKGKVIRVMDPFDVLESRAHNAVGLHGDKGPHVLTQLKWAIEVARAALLKLAADPKATQRLGGQIQRIYALASSQVGKRLWSEHQIELLGAIDSDALGKAAPMHARQLEAVRRAIEDRRRSARKPAKARSKSAKRS